MDLARALEKWADRIYIILLAGTSYWWAARHDVTTKVEELSTKLDNVVTQVNQGFQQVQARVSNLEAPAKPQVKSK